MQVRENSIYRHFKGDLYMVLYVAEHTETGHEIVVYQALLYGNCKIYARPLAMFIEEVPAGKPNPTGQKFRFESYTVASVKEVSN